MKITVMHQMLMIHTAVKELKSKNCDRKFTSWNIYIISIRERYYEIGKCSICQGKIGENLNKRFAWNSLSVKIVWDRIQKKRRIERWSNEASTSPRISGRYWSRAKAIIGRNWKTWWSLERNSHDVPNNHTVSAKSIRLVRGNKGDETGINSNSPSILKSVFFHPYEFYVQTDWKD